MPDPLKPRRGPPPSNPAAEHDAFPQHPEDFERDPRITFSQRHRKWILDDNNGSEWDWNGRTSEWVPSLDEELVKRQQAAYAVEGAEDDDEEDVQPAKKRKSHDQQNGASKKARSKPAKPQQERKNTAVYVTSLPLDTDADEVVRIFSRYGVIAEEIDSGEPRVKLYKDDQGKFKGDALVVYFRPESVNLAIQMLDDSDFRPGQTGPAGAMRVVEADASYKKQKESQEPAAGQDGAESDKTKKPKKSQDQRKIIERTQKLNAKLADWSDEDDEPSTLPETSSRYDRVVILKQMFTLAELSEDAGALLEIQEDVRDECEKLGPVVGVVVFDKEADGVVSVRFGNETAAEGCVRMMNGRHFAGRTVEAHIATGSEKFKRTLAGDGDEKSRAESFGKWLEGDENGEDNDDDD